MRSVIGFVLFVLVACALIIGCSEPRVQRYVSIEKEHIIVVLDTETGRVVVLGLTNGAWDFDESFVKYREK